MIRNIIIGLLVAAVAGTAYWGYTERQEKNAVMINAENNYQRAFHDLSYQVDLLHDKIGSTLAMNTRHSLSPALTEVWRMASEAQNDVGQLPLALLPFNKTEEFLSDIGDFTYKTAVRDLEKDPLTTDEYKRLQSLYKQSEDIQNEMRKVQYQVINNNLKWMDVETALASGDEKADNTIVDGFKTVEKKVTAYSEANSVNDISMKSTEEKNKNFQNLKGELISKKEALSIFEKYANLPDDAKVQADENKKGSKYGFYSLNASTESGLEVNMDITKKGGYPIWFMNNRDVKESKLSLHDAEKKAVNFLKEHDFTSLQLYESNQYDHIGLFNFVTVIDGVRVYPDSVKVKVALDDGTIIGVSAADYLESNKERSIKKPKLSAAQAKEKINSNVKVMEQREAVIMNDEDKEVLCHEFLGTIGNDTYRIFINAENGREEKIEKLKNAEPAYQKLL
ncbi:germination protein YpeB [Bacillus massiliglaciei]|uniref:germination protein YpeB n=1 Tax=Bacillus massiliglaciei TaxID=1816693 RepID=UPI000A584B1A|nr:germination protein YpeB [Bacillus massiliglaciei]